MKIKLIALFLFLITVSFSYSMHKTEEEMFQENIVKLSEPLQQFIKDFATWSKREQDKILLPSNSGGFNIIIKGSIVANRRYEGDIGLWLEDHFTTAQEEITLFLVLNYLKNKKK